MKTIKVRIKGTSPLLMHCFPMVPIEGLDKKTPVEQAEHAAYRDPETGGLYVPAVAIQRALVSAATFSKGKGRGNLSRVAGACFQVMPERVALGTNEYKVDSRPVVIPATKGRIMRHRPRLDAWELTFNLEYDETLLSEPQVRRIVDDMGARVGLLDFRPEKKGPFGRSVVSLWETT